MSDLISRKDAIEVIEKLMEIHFDRKVVLAKVYDQIKDLPSAETEPHWIPVTERLPDKDARYLTTCSKVGKWVVDWNIWHCEPKPEWLWEQGVTAWMPMPEPWEGEEKND